MTGLINELLTVLNEQAENYENLLALSHEKHQVLVQNDVKSLQKITNVENIIVGNNQRLEKKRMKIVSDISTVLGKKESDMTLTVLAGLIERQDEHPALVEVTKRLRATVEDLKEINERNKTLLEFSLDYIDFSMNLIRSSMSEGITDNYDASNQPDDGRSTLFQAKQ
ncbi:MAG: flagellar protein FlgN [Defluviitaleaceae bacterium]|nr:flagellar protein FlgN [Defluviitaleaceae bacterium]